MRWQSSTSLKTRGHGHKQCSEMYNRCDGTIFFHPGKEDETSHSGSSPRQIMRYGTGEIVARVQIRKSRAIMQTTGFPLTKFSRHHHGFFFLGFCLPSAFAWRLASFRPHLHRSSRYDRQVTCCPEEIPSYSRVTHLFDPSFRLSPLRALRSPAINTMFDALRWRHS